ncbi:MAG: SPOR domain-containing protein [Nitrospirota bacterium]
MKRTDSKRDSTVFYIGKGIIIIAVLIISSLSFTLGYFVGKGIQPSALNQTAVITKQKSTEQKDIAPEKKEAVVQYPTQETQQTAKTQQAQETNQIQETKENNNNPPSPPPRPLTKEGQKESKGGKGGFSDEARKTKETPKTRKYTIQAGVFKDASVADALKTNLDKKGYKTYIIPSETKKHEKLYKVMVGEFATRKEAEVLSIKIKNAESLQTFVTFKTDKEELR